jgi:hypothetical protein
MPPLVAGTGSSRRWPGSQGSVAEVSVDGSAARAGRTGAGTVAASSIARPSRLMIRNPFFSGCLLICISGSLIFIFRRRVVPRSSRQRIPDIASPGIEKTPGAARCSFGYPPEKFDYLYTITSDVETIFTVRTARLR